MVHERKEQNYLTTVSLVILAAVALTVALIYTRAVMIPFVVALFIVALVSPVEDFQVKWLRLPRLIAIPVTLLVVVAVIVAVFLIIAQATTIIVSTAGQYSASFAYMADKILEPIEYLYHEGDEKPSAPPNGAGPAAPNVPAPPAEPEPLVLFPVVTGADEEATIRVLPQSEAMAEDPNAFLDPNGVVSTDALPSKAPRINTKQIVKDMRNYIFNIVTNAFGTILGLISGMFFVIIFVIFLLLGRNPHTKHSHVYIDVVQKVRRYIAIKTIASAITGVLVWTILHCVGLKLAVAFGILAFLLNFIPSIGSIIATLLPIPIAVVQFQSTPWFIVFVVVVPGLVQTLIGSFIEPKLQGEGLNLHPVTVILALAFWGLIWGIVGMFLAAPITAALRVFLMQFDTLRPIGKVLAGDFSRTPSSAD